MAQHTYKDLTNNKGSKIIQGLTKDTPVLEQGQLTAFDNINYQVHKVRKIFLAGVEVYQYELVTEESVFEVKDKVNTILDLLKELI